MSDFAPELSLVVAVRTRASGRRWLERIGAQASSADTEIILVGTGVDENWSREGVIVEMAAAAQLTPELWTHGILRSRARAIALTVADCLPAEDWIEAIHTALAEADAVAIGGAIELDPSGTVADWAVHFLRYSRFMLPIQSGPTIQIAADNAVYRRWALDRYPESWHEGFWETAVHHLFLRDGLGMRLDPRLVVSHRRSLSLIEFSQQRFRHGRQFAARRFAQAGHAARLLRVAVAPLAGAAVFGRVVRAVFVRRRHRLRLTLSMPFLLWFVVCWIAGETCGYLQPPIDRARA